MTDFKFPWEYQFPPFYSLQPNVETRKVQIKAWRSLILDFCQHHNIHQLHLRDWLSKPPFYNESIERRLSLDALRLIIQSLVDSKFAEWVGPYSGKDRDTCIIYFKSPEQWAQIIYDYVKEQSLHNTIVTFYEMLEGESTQDKQFHGLDEHIFLKALKILEKQGKAAVMELDGSKGVKFV